MNTTNRFNPLLSTAVMEALPAGRLRRVPGACLSVLWPRKLPDQAISQYNRGFARAVYHRRRKDDPPSDLDWGMALARRQSVHWLYAVHQHLKQALRREIQSRPPILVPADPFAVFLLFVVAADPGALAEEFRTREVFSELGKHAALGIILASEDWVTEAGSVAGKILDSIAEIQESQGNPQAGG
jgi:hypothetical protein